jgi:hypothetical protein
MVFVQQQAQQERLGLGGLVHAAASPVGIMVRTAALKKLALCTDVTCMPGWWQSQQERLGLVGLVAPAASTVGIMVRTAAPNTFAMCSDVT